MRKHRTLLRRLWRNAPPERVPMIVRWFDGETTTIISGGEPDANGDTTAPPTKTTPPVVDGKPRSQ